MQQSRLELYFNCIKASVQPALNVIAAHFMMLLLTTIVIIAKTRELGQGAKLCLMKLF